jgi:hypothetical protein
MRQTIKWLEEIALAETGAVPAPELDKRVTALRELQSNYMNMNATQFTEAMTTAHFAYYFSDAISRAFYKDYAYMVGSWKAYTYSDTVPDFRDVDRFRMSEPGTLFVRAEKAEAKATYVTDTEIHYGVEEFARQFDVSWRTIMNDDLGKIKETPQRMATAAARWLDTFVSNLYDNAVAQATLAALGAPWAGTGRLTAPNLAIGLNAMMQRTDVNGDPLNFKRIHLVIPPVLRIQAADILKDLISYGGPGGNVLADFMTVGDVHSDPYIATAGANVPWYLVADPSEAPAITLARLQGWSAPIVAMKRSNIEMVLGNAPAAFLMGSFETGDIEYLVEDVVGGWDDASFTGITDFRALYYSSGTTP